MMTNMRMTDSISAEPPYFCDICPRLSEFLVDCREKHPTYFNGPVNSFGDPNPELLIIGLAPGLHGANQTGRPFTGDAAGDLLYKVIADYGFSNDRFRGSIHDGLELKRAMITNAVRCVPPQNKPIGAEITACRNYLKAQIEALPRLKLLLCLGKISHDSTVRALGAKLSQHKFAHGAEYKIDNYTLLSSYHCSRYNTNTGRLNEAMFQKIFSRARHLVDCEAV